MNSKVQSMVFILFGLIFADSSAQTQACESIIALSRLTNSEVYSAEKVQAEAQEFCSEYKRYKSTGKLSSIGASYKVFSANASKTSSNVEEVASKYCGGSSSSGADKNAHRTYVESIAPGAFIAYERCLAMASRGVNVTILSVDNSKMTLQVAHKTNNSGDKALVTYVPSGNAQCKWQDNQELPAVRYIDGNTTRLIECARTAGSDVDTSVSVSRQDTGQGDGVQFEWPLRSRAAKDAELAQMKAQYNEMKNELVQAWASLVSGVLAFESKTCPAGWVEYKPAYGRFIRGIDKSDKPADPLGTRAPGSLQDADMAAHTHATLTYNAAFGGNRRAGAAGSNRFDAANLGGFNVKETGSFGGQETRPSNVALLFCQRSS